MRRVIRSVHEVGNSIDRLRQVRWSMMRATANQL
jgi:hypothetical protein